MVKFYLINTSNNLYIIFISIFGALTDCTFYNNELIVHVSSFTELMRLLTFETKYSRMDQVEFVEDRVEVKNLLSPLLNTLSQLCTINEVMFHRI